MSSVHASLRDCVREHLCVRVYVCACVHACVRVHVRTFVYM